ncbi:hypothetical protein VNI00_015561 [Paramarasmius palmivorus]|uniref:NACHT domain-containing protein n=1 Tax=Paramarasmius palmivorus TaxID=297713 RepID=A0AAW0BLI4_9AGAR
MALNGSHVTVGRDAHNMVHGDQINIVYNLTEAEGSTLRELAQKAAPNACYDSEQRFPPPNCHEGTRVQMIADISNWIEDDFKATRVLWVHGTAGIGKSAIAQHIAEKYAETRLAAAFFFSRNDSTRDSINPFIASIAYQLCKGSLSHPIIRSKIIEAISVNPNVLEASCEVQLRSLIVEPCLRADLSSWNVMRNLLVIDGLDECIHRPSQKRVLELIRRFISISLPSWTVLLCSRLESQIQDAIKQVFGVGGALRQVDMNYSDELNRDIARYLTDEFSRIRRERRRVLGIAGALWPGNDAIDELVRRADKQMIFAVTVISYVDTRDDPPQDRLATVRHIFVKDGTDSPYSALDTLYHQILSTCGSKWEEVQPILRLLVTHEYPGSPEDRVFDHTPWRSPAMIAFCLGVSEARVQVTLEKLHSVLLIHSDEEDNINHVSIAHATFTEFLSDCCRSAGFYTPKMTQSEHCEILALFSLRTLRDLAHEYPPYHIHSFAEAMLLWEKKWKGINTGSLRTLVLNGWSLWRSITSPLSPDLVKVLSNLDIYHFISLWHQDWFNRHHWEVTFAGDLKGGIHLEEQIELAKSRESMPREFTERLKLFEGIDVMNLAFPSDTTGNFVFWGTRWAEQCCWRPLAVSSLNMVDAFLPRGSASNGFLVLPSDSSHCEMSVPEDWIIASITKENSELELELYDAINWRGACDEERYMLLGDIRNNTSFTVANDIVQEDVLIRFKKLLKERLDIIRRLSVKLHDTEDPEAFWSWVDCDGEYSNGNLDSSSIRTSTSNLSCKSSNHPSAIMKWTLGWQSSFQWCSHHSKFCVIHRRKW